MARGRDPEQRLPPHIEEAVAAIAKLHVEHVEAATPLQRAIGGLTRVVAQPRTVGWLTVFVAAWIGLNLLAPQFGVAGLDPPPFTWLVLALSLAALYLMVLILTAQRRDDELAELREQLTLELALLSEQKTAKMIELLEEFRRDIPLVENRQDDQADAMAHPADPQSVVEALRQTAAETARLERAGTPL